MRRFIVFLALIAVLIVSRNAYAQELPKGAFSLRILSLFNNLSDTSSSLSPTPPIQAVSAIPTPVLPLPTPLKKSYKIAVFGDSMVDTMGEVMEYLEHSLKARYPTTQFTLYNYGQGSQNVEDGLSRFYNEFNYKDRHYPSLVAVQPDILIIGSFAYNPFSPNDQELYKKLYKKLLLRSRNIANDVYMLTEIAPLRSEFGQGPNGVNWDVPTSYEHSGWIVSGLENSLLVAKELDIPTINVFQLTLLNPQTKEGMKKYVNPSDGIHPSVAGHEFIADTIASTILLR